MPRGFGRLRFFSRPVAADRASSGPSEAARIDADAAPIGPPMLLPAMIYHQVLFDSTEFTPTWLPKGAARAVAPSPKAPTSKATRGKKAGAKPSESKPVATRKRRRPSSDRGASQ
jgi:hypothetical protein